MFGRGSVRGAWAEVSCNLDKLKSFHGFHGLGGGACRIQFEQMMTHFRASISNARDEQGTGLSDETNTTLLDLMKSIDDTDSNTNGSARVPS